MRNPRLLLTVLVVVSAVSASAATFDDRSSCEVRGKSAPELHCEWLWDQTGTLRLQDCREMGVELWTSDQSIISQTAAPKSVIRSIGRGGEGLAQSTTNLKIGDVTENTLSLAPDAGWAAVPVEKSSSAIALDIRVPLDREAMDSKTQYALEARLSCDASHVMRHAVAFRESTFDQAAPRLAANGLIRKGQDPAVGLDISNPSLSTQVLVTNVTFASFESPLVPSDLNPDNADLAGQLKEVAGGGEIDLAPSQTVSLQIPQSDLRGEYLVLAYQHVGGTGEQQTSYMQFDVFDIGLPSLDQWATILLLLVLATTGVVAIRIKAARLSHAGTGTTIVADGSLFEARHFVRWMAIVGAAAVLWLGYTSWSTSALASADVLGAMAAAPLLAYLLHLLTTARSQR